MPARRAAPAQREAFAPQQAAEPPMPPAPRTGLAAPLAPVPQPRNEPAGIIQQSIARIQEACQAPPLAPPEYRLLFEIMAKEITDNDLIGAQTLTNITQRAQERGLDVRRDDVRFVLEVVSEADPWFEQGASANLFAGRFRNFVVARCRGQGLNLSADELDLIDAWFAGGTLPPGMAAPKAGAGRSQRRTPRLRHSSLPQPQKDAPRAGGRSTTAARTISSSTDGTRSRSSAGRHQRRATSFPRIVRTRLRG